MNIDDSMLRMFRALNLTVRTTTAELYEMKGAMAAVQGSFGLTAGAIAGFEATKRKITETTISLTALEDRYERMVHTMDRAVPALPAPSSHMLPAVPNTAQVIALPPAAASSAMLPALPAPSSVPPVPALPQPATAQQNKAAQPKPKPTQKRKPSTELFEQFVREKAGLLFESTKSMAQASVGAAWENQAIKEQYALRLGDADAGAAMFDRFRQEALQAGADAKEYLAGSLDNLAVTRDAEQASQLNRFARQLSLFDSQGGGLGGSFAALQAAMKGDVGSLSGRFGVSESLLQQFNIEELAKSGDMSGFIAAFDQMLEAANMGKAVMDTMFDSPTRKLEALQNNIQTMFAQAGEGAIQAFAPVIDLLYEAFQNGSFQPLFDALNIGLTLAADMLARVAQGVIWIWELVSQYWPAIAATLLTLATAFIPMIISGLWGMVAPILAQAAAWAMANWPVLLIAAAVGLLIYMLQQFGVTTEEIVGYVVGAFYVLFTAIYNKIAYLWNYLVIFAEFFINVFRDPIYAIKMLFYNLAINFMEHVYNMVRSAEDFGGAFTKIIVGAVNGALETFNWFVDKINGIFGTDFKRAELFDENNIHAVSDKIKNLMDRLEKPVSDKDVVDLSGYRMKEKNLKDSFDKGFDRGAGLLSKATNAFNMKNDSSSTGNGNIPRVDEVGRVGAINDTVDIASEDLVTMRELAEMQSIQNFVTLTPTVQVTTGDVHREADIDILVSKIESKLEEQFTSSAQGVYA